MDNLDHNDLKKGYASAKEVNAVIIAERKKFSMAIGQYDIIDYNTEAQRLNFYWKTSMMN